MEKGEKRRRPLVNELTQGRDLANQLLKHHLLHLHKTSSYDFLLQQILSSYEKALSIITSTTHSDSDSSYPPQSHIHKKSRKTTRELINKWSEDEQVKVCSVEAAVGDGYSWRKYGQKDILGANYPRAYYRCSHRNLQGCLATKQVQRSDEDSSAFEVTYRGRHTCCCIQPTQLSKPKKSEEEEEEKKCFNIDAAAGSTFKAYNNNNNKDHPHEEAGLFPSFSFDSTPIETEKLENLFYSGNLNNLQTSDSSCDDLSDIINSTQNSVTNSGLGDLDWDFDLDVDVDFSIDYDVTDSV